MKKSWFKLTTILFLVASALPAFCQSILDQPRDSLKGISSVQVLVELEYPPGTAVRLSKKELVAKIKDRLARDGVPVASTMEEASDRLARVVVSVEISPSRDKRLLVYSVNFAFRQLVDLKSRTGSVYAATWQRFEVGDFHELNINPVPDIIERMASDFAGEFRSVNPK